MYHCQFSIQNQIRYQRYHHPDPIVRKRMTIPYPMAILPS
jgi:hypothetical protein